MEFYLIAIAILFALAVAGLVVGVSNDAVNFLNSAVGSKVASRRTILMVASAGIVIGAAFSSGMMEVARNGIFNPDRFFFSDVMLMFLAVMITDVILLDFFNTFGLPTSTTVSIIFGLLGAAVAIALLKTLEAGGQLADAGAYINSGKALTIIVGIFISVGIAFVFGMGIQYLSRLLFSFDYEKRIKVVGAVWSGLALTSMTYFLVVKGFKGASFVTDDFVAWVDAYTWELTLGVFIGWTAVSQILIMSGVEVLRIVVLVGTFSLAMAFAGNDMVNFIGVPIAGFDALGSWSSSGNPADQYLMTDLLNPVRSRTWMLLFAGLIMVATLWISRKARAVTQTEVNLGRQEEGFERFRPSAIARIAVGLGLQAGRTLRRLIPERWIKLVEASFATHRSPLHDHPDRPAFDLVRASVNMAVASMLIAAATSFKLPLSTTYVTFMVAMGSSLADRAWGRDSAVYRIAGVLSVIGGWFLTAVAAFIAAALCAAVLYFMGWIGLLVLVTIVAAAFVRGLFIFKRRQEESDLAELAHSGGGPVAYLEAVGEIHRRARVLLEGAEEVYGKSLDSVFNESKKEGKQALRRLGELERENELFGLNLHTLIRSTDEESVEISHMYVRLYDYGHDLAQSLRALATACDVHVRNHHKPLGIEQVTRLTELRGQLVEYLKGTASYGEPGGNGYRYRPAGTRFPDPVRDGLIDRTWALYAEQADGLRAKRYGKKNTQLVLRILLDSKDLVAIAARFREFDPTLSAAIPLEFPAKRRRGRATRSSE